MCTPSFRDLSPPTAAHHPLRSRHDSEQLVVPLLDVHLEQSIVRQSESTDLAFKRVSGEVVIVERGEGREHEMATIDVALELIHTVAGAEKTVADGVR